MARLTDQKLRDRLTVRPGCTHGQYIVEIKYRGKTYTCTSTNSLAWDKIYYGIAVPWSSYYDNERQAMQAFYDECKTKNNLK